MIVELGRRQGAGGSQKSPRRDYPYEYLWSTHSYRAYALYEIRLLLKNRFLFIQNENKSTKISRCR